MATKPMSHNTPCPANAASICGWASAQRSIQPSEVITTAVQIADNIQWEMTLLNPNWDEWTLEVVPDRMAGVLQKCLGDDFRQTAC